MKTELYIHSNSFHTAGVITGFHSLAERGETALQMHDLRREQPMTDAVIRANVDGRNVVFDLADGYCYEDKTAVHTLFAEADLIFKRSFSKEKNQQFPAAVREKIRPFGLNYFVTYRDNPITKSRFSVRSLLKTLKLTASYETDFEAPILKPNAHPNILFLTRLWDPNGADIVGDAALRAEREYINQMRTDTVRLLKKEFGTAFFGGIYTDDFSARYCPELLVNKSVSLKRVYLARMKHSDICINTMGLHGSTGWKTAEYVAAARAIVSEPLCYEVTGDFGDGTHYLSFRTPEECAAQVTRLMERPTERVAMSARNQAYYATYLKPEAQVKQALAVLQREEIG